MYSDGRESREMIKIGFIGIYCLILIGCAARPPTVGDSTLQLKTTSFPKQGQQVHAVAGGLVHLRANYQSSFSFRLVNPLSMGFYLGRVLVSTNDSISQASMDGDVVFCTRSKTYIDPLTGPHAIACFQSNEQGKFNSVKAAPGAMWFSKQLSPPIDYVSSEMALNLNGKPFKRELIFDGSHNQMLLFTEKIYDKSVETASQLKPFMVKVESSPSKVSVNGAEINVISYTINSLTYTLEKAWD